MSRISGFRSVMLPLDGSRFAEAAIPYALGVAKRARCRMQLVLVLPDDHSPGMIETATVYLNELTQRLGGQLEGSLSSVILNGPVVPSLVNHAQEMGADLVVMTTHGLGGLRRAWLGSVADELIRTIEIPVLVTRPGEDVSLHSPDFHQILVPLDGSLLAEVATQPAAAIAKLWDGEISLLQVLQPSDPAQPSPLRCDAELTRVRRESAHTYLGEVADRVRLTGARVSGDAVVETADISRALLGFAQRERIGLIAMATHGRGGVRRLLLGSVTNRMVRTAEVPVLVVPLSHSARRVAKAQLEMSRHSA